MGYETSDLTPAQEKMVSIAQSPESSSHMVHWLEAISLLDSVGMSQGYVWARFDYHKMKAIAKVFNGGEYIVPVNLESGN